jgi:hypothetical protein
MVTVEGRRTPATRWVESVGDCRPTDSISKSTDLTDRVVGGVTVVCIGSCWLLREAADRLRRVPPGFVPAGGPSAVTSPHQLAQPGRPGARAPRRCRVGDPGCQPVHHDVHPGRGDPFQSDRRHPGHPGRRRRGRGRPPRRRAPRRRHRDPQLRHRPGPRPPPVGRPAHLAAAAPGDPCRADERRFRGGTADRTPGEFRRTQNWIGGSSPSNARFVPPPVEQMQAALHEWEVAIHADDDLPVLVKIGLLHAQFETIHPSSTATDGSVVC